MTRRPSLLRQRQIRQEVKRALIVRVVTRLAERHDVVRVNAPRGVVILAAHNVRRLKIIRASADSALRLGVHLCARRFPIPALHALSKISRRATQTSRPTICSIVIVVLPLFVARVPVG
jgi:hypothetical protein